MDYSKLSHEDFDAIVTGELTHFALWIEEALNAIVADYLVGRRRSKRRGEFYRLILYREGLRTQDKLEIVRCLLSKIEDQRKQRAAKALLERVQAFKSFRNVLAHGLSNLDGETIPVLEAEIIGRNGKARVVRITPEYHKELVEQGESLVAELARLRSELHA